MSNAKNLQQVLENIRAVVRLSETFLGDSAQATGAYTDRAALLQAHDMANLGLALVSEAHASAVATLDQSPQSSVEIETLAKSAVPKITVKVYDRDPSQALALAARLYSEAITLYTEATMREEAAAV